MIRLKKHIAIFLFGIFVFPVLFQSLHIVSHHLHKIKTKATLTSTEAAEIGFPLKIRTASQKERNCPVCAYQFSLKDIPQTFVMRSFIPLCNCYYNETSNSNPYQKALVQKSPRAPPVNT